MIAEPSQIGFFSQTQRPCGSGPTVASQILPQTLEERVPDLSVSRLRAVLDLGQKLGLDPDALVGDPLREGLRLPDERLESLAQVGSRYLVESVVDLAGVHQFVAFAPADVEAVPFAPSSAKPAIVRVSRCAQVFLTQSLLRPVGYPPSRTLDTTPSRPSLQACPNIAWPSISKLSLNWMSVPATIFFSSALRWISGSFRRSRPFK